MVDGERRIKKTQPGGHKTSLWLSASRGGAPSAPGTAPSYTSLPPPLSMAKHQPRSCLLADLHHQPAICLVARYHHQQQQQLLQGYFNFEGSSEMGDCRGGTGDCLIKLFGTTIPFPEAGDAKDLQHSGRRSSSSSSSTESDAKENTHQDTSDPPPQPEVVDAEDPDSSSRESQQTGDDEADRREKLKKPDKVLPCPRCSSMDTKFCYFNNYNVNQPRHFCKNCQRYWTAGGAMRNVPVGAGRRKNKNAVAASHFLQRVRAALPAGDPLKTSNGTVLSFGHGVQAVDLAEQVSHLKENLLIPNGNAGDKLVDPCSEGSSSREDRNPSHTREKVALDNNGVQQHPTNMWPYSCAPSQAYYPPGMAIPIYPGYWGCMVPGGWSLPWPVQSPTPQGFSSPTSAPSVSSGPDSLTLGKHARDGDEGRSHKVWAPKTIRIDDADEVAKSSIWSLIGMKGDKQNMNIMDGRKHGTVFESKLETKTAKQAMITSSPLLHANPVALTRSLTFQEGS